MKLVTTALLSTLLLTNTNIATAAGDAHHFPGIFLGYTDIESEDKPLFTYGLEYEYKFNSYFGVGAVYEKTDDAHGDDGITVTLGSLYYHPSKNIRLGIGAGQEKLGGAHPHTEDLYRVSASYDFHVGDFGLAPTFAVDFIDGHEAYVLGVALIRPF